MIEVGLICVCFSPLMNLVADNRDKFISYLVFCFGIVLIGMDIIL